MKGNFGSGRRPSLKKRLESSRRQNRALADRDAANRCKTCKGPLGPTVFTYALASRDRYCRALCVPVIA